MIDSFIRVMYNRIEQNQSEIEEKRRRDGLRKGSIDVEFRIIE